jgi:hypothetical protein
MLIKKYLKFTFKDKVVVILCSFLGFLLGVLPQLFVQKIIYGSFFYQPYLFGEHGGGFNIYYNLIPKALLSVERGLFLWSPVLFFALIGFFYWKKKRYIRNVFLIYLIIFVILIGSWEGILSAGYGNRFFVDTFPVMVFGLASFIESVRRRKALHLITFMLILWNVLLLNQFFYDKKRLVDLKDITYTNFLTGMVESPIKMFGDLRKHGLSNFIRIEILD